MASMVKILSGGQTGVDRSGDIDRAAACLRACREQGVVCIAGPRESEAPGIYKEAHSFLCELLGALSR